MTAAGASPHSAPCRVLVAEDEFLVFLALEEDLRANGFAIVGPFTTLAEAHDAVMREPVDLALLDINLCGEMIFPVADELLARNVPFIFLSGYSSAAVPEGYRQFLRFEKPYDPAKLMDALRQLSQEKPPRPEAGPALRGEGTELPAA
jgi:two-component system, response regulator PdtaR